MSFDQSPPSYLKGRALEEWEAIVPDLAAFGHVLDLDRSTLVAFCRLMAISEAAGDTLLAHGLVVHDSRGDIRKSPAWPMWRDSSRMVAKLANDLGATPAARARMGLRRPESPTDPEGILD